jgi:hypothetical protein
MKRILYIAIVAAMLAACNSNKQEAAEQANTETVTDLQRDGIRGQVKKYTHQEYNTSQQNGEWKQGDSLLVHTEYNYDSAGMLQRVADLVANGQQAAATRQYKRAPGQPLAIISYDMAHAISRSTRTWSSDNHYTEKTYFQVDTKDTANWQMLQQVTFNGNNLPIQYTSTMRAEKDDTTYTNTAWLYYDADNHISRKVLYNSADSVVIYYTILQKDDKGNPTQTLKQYPQRNEYKLLVDGYEYY